VRALCVLVCLPLFAQSDLDREITKIAESDGGTVGVAAMHLESGKVFAMRGKDPFPMASVFKLPIAMQVLDRNEPRLDILIKLMAWNIRPFRSHIAEMAPHGGPMFTITELLDYMVVESDNTAADMLLNIPGVNWYLGKLGVAGIRIDRGEGEMALDYAGVTSRPPEVEWALDWFNKAAPLSC
jgi:beta-lactamase class A